jgi:hypothetical protein
MSVEQTSLAEMAQEPATAEVVENTQNSGVAENEVADADATDASKDDAGEDTNSDDAGSESEQPKVKKGFEKRISKEVARKNEALREAEYWKKVALEQGAKAPQEQKQAQTVTEKPKFSDYNDIELYTEAVTDWKLERKVAEMQQQNKQKSATETYNSRVKEFEKTRPDFQEVLASTELRISQPVTELILESDVGPAVVLYLAENEEETERINGLSPARQLAEIGKIEAKLSAKPAKTEKKTVSKAPSPVTPIQGGQIVAKKSLDDPGLSADDWIKMRNKERGFR